MILTLFKRLPNRFKNLQIPREEIALLENYRQVLQVSRRLVIPGQRRAQLICPRPFDRTGEMDGNRSQFPRVLRMTFPFWESGT